MVRGTLDQVQAYAKLSLLAAMLQEERLLGLIGRDISGFELGMYTAV